MDGGLRHLPRGVDQYLELRAKQQRDAERGSRTDTAAVQKPSGPPKLAGAELRNAEKEFAAGGRKIEKLNGQIAALHVKMAEHDQSDYAGLGELSTELSTLQASLSAVETRWLELSELLG
jgi:hypothetical protein